MNILVTGCAGFIGSNLCEELVNQGYNVFGLDNLMTGYRKNIQNLEEKENFKFIEADIRDFELINQIIKENNITHISHQAARGSVPKSVEDPILTNEINVNGTLNMLWAAVTNNVKVFVCAISSSVYGDTPILPKVETMEYNPQSPYAITKVTKEQYCKLFYKLYGLKTISMRYFNVYGKRQDPNGAYAAVIPKWITNALNDGDLPINGEGDQTRDFTYISDVVQMNINSLLCKKEEAFGKAYNVAFGHRISLQELAKSIIEITSSKSRIVNAPARKGDIKDSFADINLARKYLGYDPKNSFTSGLKKTIEWFKKNENY